MPEPRVSVVVPTHRRSARLALLLDSLDAQTLGTDQFEVIVVDDDPDRAATAVVGRHDSRSRLNVRLLNPPRPGPAAARNAGWRAARAPLVAFTDDDCAADPAWLERALRVAEANPEALIQGRTLPNPSEADATGLLSRTITVDSLGPQYETCNVFYPRELLAGLGGFDERFGAAPAAEDTDLAWRAIERGAPAVFADDAIVFHAVERIGVLGQLAVARRWERAIRVFATHPGARSMLYRGVFWNVWHYLLLRSALSLLGPRWLARMVLTMHLLTLGRRARDGRAGPWAIPYLLVHDAVECWAVARGALRYRTFVL